MQNLLVNKQISLFLLKVKLTYVKFGAKVELKLSLSEIDLDFVFYVTDGDCGIQKTIL